MRAGTASGRVAAHRPQIERRGQGEELGHGGAGPGHDAAGAQLGERGLIESSDGENQWRTVGISSNIIEASWLALADSLEYWLLKKSAR